MKIKINEKTFDKVKISAVEKISAECISDIACNIGQTGDDFLSDMYTIQLVGFIQSRTIEERKLTYSCDRPTFFDWLFRRKKVVQFDFKASDLLIKKAENGTLRIYDISLPLP